VRRLAGRIVDRRNSQPFGKDFTVLAPIPNFAMPADPGVFNSSESAALFLSLNVGIRIFSANIMNLQPLALIFSLLYFTPQIHFESLFFDRSQMRQIFIC